MSHFLHPFSYKQLVDDTQYEKGPRNVFTITSKVTKEDEFLVFSILSLRTINGFEGSITHYFGPRLQS